MLTAHGHNRDARLSLATPERTRQQIASGAERFEQGGLSTHQSLSVQLARMGCVVWQWDMLSDSDSVQIPRELVHTFARQRPEMNTAENWGLYLVQPHQVEFWQADPDRRHIRLRYEREGSTWRRVLLWP